jgi:hypothetical protein
MLISGLAHAIVNAILTAGKDKMSGRGLIDGFSALLIARGNDRRGRMVRSP